MSTCRWGASVSVAAISGSPFSFIYLCTCVKTYTLIKNLASLHLDWFVLTGAYERPPLWFSDIFHSNKAWHAAEELDSFDQYSGKYGVRNPSRILAWGNCCMTTWWIILQVIWGGSFRSGRRGRMFKIHVGECSGTRSDVNSNSAFMSLCVDVCVCVHTVVWGENSIYSPCSLYLSSAEKWVGGLNK